MAIDFAAVKAFLSADGQKELVDFIRQAREERGAGYLESLKAEFPTFAWVIDLVANYTAEESFQRLQREFPLLPLALFKKQIFDLHATLAAEIDKPRG